MSFPKDLLHWMLIIGGIAIGLFLVVLLGMSLVIALVKFRMKALRPRDRTEANDPAKEEKLGGVSG